MKRRDKTTKKKEVCSPAAEDEGSGPNFEIPFKLWDPYSLFLERNKFGPRETNAAEKRILLRASFPKCVWERGQELVERKKEK